MEKCELLEIDKEMNNYNILTQIESLKIDQSIASLTFSQRLARENSWTESFSNRVISEYKKFIYLVYLSDTEITPSDEVDQAWHLHLTYTKSYWGDLCKEILGFELHHLPTKGGRDEQNRYKQQYINTLSLYEEVFAEKPPTDIWPTVDKRFEAVEKFVRVNLKNKWVIRKPSLSLQRLMLVIATPIFLVACTENLGDKEIWFWVLVALFGLIFFNGFFNWLDPSRRSKQKSFFNSFTLSWRSKKSDDGGGCGGGGCGGCGGCGG